MRVWPRKLPAAFPTPVCVLCSSLKHVVFGARILRADADEFVVLEAKARCETVATDGFLRLLVAVAKHRLGVDMAIVASDRSQWCGVAYWRLAIGNAGYFSQFEMQH
jgi:hypothetical protein